MKITEIEYRGNTLYKVSSTALSFHPPEVLYTRTLEQAQFVLSKLEQSCVVTGLSHVMKPALFTFTQKLRSVYIVRKNNADIDYTKRGAWFLRYTLQKGTITARDAVGLPRVRSRRIAIGSDLPTAFWMMVDHLLCYNKKLMRDPALRPMLNGALEAYEQELAELRKVDYENPDVATHKRRRIYGAIVNEKGIKEGIVKEVIEDVPQVKKRGRGRPKGSKNKPKPVQGTVKKPVQGTVNKQAVKRGSI